MKRQAFQPGEIRDEQDNIIRPGAYGKKTAFATADNNGILDYIMNNFEVLKDALSGAVVSATVSDATITFIHKDASKSTVTVNNVAHAGKASQDDKGQAIDISALKTLITTTVNDAVLQCKKDLYPVGSVYVSITDSRNPADILGFGTWKALPAGYGLVAQGTATAEDGSTLTFTAGQKSGEFKHQLTIGELPERTVVSLHPDPISALTIPWNTAASIKWGATSLYDYKNAGVITEYEKAHNNISPCVSAYIWLRTA